MPPNVREPEKLSTIDQLRHGTPTIRKQFSVVTELWRNCGQDRVAVIHAEVSKEELDEAIELVEKRRKLQHRALRHELG